MAAAAAAFAAAVLGCFPCFLQVVIDHRLCLC